MSYCVASYIIIEYKSKGEVMGQMKRLLVKLQTILNSKKLQQQLYSVYVLAILIPIIALGAFLVINTSQLLSNHYRDLSESNNLRAKTILIEITTKIYNLSEEIAFDSTLHNILSSDYLYADEYYRVAGPYNTLNNYLQTYSEIGDIKVYTNNPKIQDYKQIERAKQSTVDSDWYQKAIHQSSIFWMPKQSVDMYGNVYYSLCLIRKIPLVESENNGVLVIEISENYLKSRLNITDYETVVYIEDSGLVFSSNRLWYEEDDIIPSVYEEGFYERNGKAKIDKEDYMTSVSTLKFFQSDNKGYICTMNHDFYMNISEILGVCILIILVAVLLPFILIRFFATNFSGRVDTLREAMHKASNEDYDVPVSLQGEDEISQAFMDLLKMVSKIKKKDSDMYEARISAEQLLNAQQKMEMKMLASQINPHFLYNTLETIRMKAFKVGNKDVANAIKLLGKSMRYVLDNTGTTSTTLRKELDYIETYLQIQKLRFEERVNYAIEIDEDMNPEEYDILPLLVQPIVENAMAHALEKVEEAGWINIKVYTKEDEYLHIDISDNGCGMDKDTLEQLKIKLNTPNLKLNQSIGLYNINQRIKLCYGAEYGLFIESTPDVGTKVCLLLPLIEVFY